ncbi:MAG: DUF1570 domain-containing protein [Planctomycetota bacterium]|nr:DUF1570 domain-containing protein [Planctomycetota bacterium]
MLSEGGGADVFRDRLWYIAEGKGGLASGTLCRRAAPDVMEALTDGRGDTGLNSVLRIFAAAILTAIAAAVASAGEVRIRVAGQTVSGEVVSVTDKAVTMKVGGREQVLNTALLDAKSLYLCKKAVAAAEDAGAAFELGKFCHSKGLKEEAEFEFSRARRLDPAGYTAKVDAFLTGADSSTAPRDNPRGPATGPDGRKTEPHADGTKEARPATATQVLAPTDKQPASLPDRPDPAAGCSKCGSSGFVRCPECRASKDFWCSECEKGKPECKRCRNSGCVTCDRCGAAGNADETIRKLLDIRQKQLEKMKKLQEVCGIKDMITIETAHYRVYADMDHNTAHKVVGWNEHLYQMLSRLLDHKEGDMLWNDKCDIYYFDTMQKFREFAAKVDRSAVGVASGGYFTHRGRDVHIVIPFYDMIAGESKKERRAHNTLFHEGTHAFLQLTGEAVRIMPWLHEGLAQYMEVYIDNFVYCGGDPSKRHLTEGFQRNSVLLRDDIARNNIQSFETMMRASMISPQDPRSYAYAWSMVTFLVKVHPAKFTKMVKLIKEKMSKMPNPHFPGDDRAYQVHKEAIEEAFGYDLKKIEEGWLNWLKASARNGFKD